MIDRSVYEYLIRDVTLNNILSNRVYLIQAPTANPPKLPWLIVESMGGRREKISQTFIEEIAVLRITVDAAPNQLVVGRSACERAHDLLENYRGMLYNSNDVEITCTSIVGTSGIGGVYRYSFTASVRSVESFTLPVNYVK